MVVHTSVPWFPSDFSGLLVFVYVMERKTRNKLTTFCIIEPLPGLLAALATLSEVILCSE